MKTKEFIKSVERLGFTVNKNQEFIRISRYDRVVANISLDQEKEISTRFLEYSELDHEKKRLLFHVLVMYANTPLKDREEPKKYYLRLKGAENYTSSAHTYLNKRNDFMPHKYNIANRTELCTSKIQTKFTQTEIDELPKELLEAFDQIEVEDED